MHHTAILECIRWTESCDIACCTNEQQAMHWTVCPPGEERLKGESGKTPHTNVEYKCENNCPAPHTCNLLPTGPPPIFEDTCIAKVCE